MQLSDRALSWSTGSLGFDSSTTKIFKNKTEMTLHKHVIK
jgi:hypothetical protein